MVDIAPILGPFLARPPTPPRESATKVSNDTTYLNSISRTNSLLDTPDESPASSAEYSKESSGKTRKRVGFSGWTQYHRHSPIGSRAYNSDEQKRRLPPSRECNPTKSILKPYVNASIVKSTESLSFDEASLPGMLRSAALHLASGSRSAKIDAYTSLLGFLSAYEEVLDPLVLAETGEEITGAVRRDIDAKNQDGTLDVPLAAHALKLVTVLLCTKGTTNLLPDEFCSFIFEQSITCMEDPNSPKMLVSHYMHLLEKQKFSPKILTVERATRLLLVLGIITTRIKGNRVVCHRLNIYQRLLTQAKPLMVSRVGSWIDNLVSGMLSTIKEVRARAIAFGMEAGLQFGTIGSVSQECMNVFNRQSPEGTKVVDFLASRLLEMTKTKEDGLHVPQIWSVVLLFFRSRTQQIERWEHLKLWLGILQQCFNTHDAQIKFQANIAWNRLIFALDISTSTSPSMAKMLKQPIVSQLERKSPERNAKLAKQIARSSYCSLLYYALRPSATHAQLDQYWDLYVAELLPKAFSGTQNDVDYACKILANLFFNNSQPRVWDANKANANGPMKPDELPVLDSKWLRSKTESVLETMKRFFELADWTEAENHSVVLAWRNFMSALGNASSKEVKVSMGTMTSVAKLLNCLKMFLTQRISNSKGPDNLMKFTMLLKDAIAKIGHIPFHEKRLLLTQSHEYEAAGETPSGRGTSRSASLDSATTHLVDLLLDMKGSQDTGSRKIALETVVHLAVQNASSRRSRIKNLRNLARQISVEHALSSAEGPSLLWNSIAEELIGALGLPRMTEKHNDSPENSGHEYRDVVKILELGVHLHSKIIDEAWSRLFSSLCEAIKKEVGNIAIILVMQEPLAEVIRAELGKQCDEMTTGYAICLLKSVQWPINSKVIEYTQMQLWGVQIMPHKSDPQELLKPCQRLTGTLLQAVYTYAESMGGAAASSTISTTTSLLTMLPYDDARQFLKEAQQGFAVWIEDPARVIDHKSSVLAEVERMHETVKTVFEGAQKFDNTLLTEFQKLLISCLSSRHKSLVNQTVLMWNCTLGAADDLNYSDDLQKVLSKLRDWTNIQLPKFPLLGDGEAQSSPLHFDASEESEEDGFLQIQHTTPNKRLFSEQLSPRFSTPSKRLATISVYPRSASVGPSPHQTSARRDIKTTPTAKLRHNDSQIHFAAIESSPTVEESMESQMLTDRQKEVKDRQRREAALFPNIRSSPRGAPVVTQYRLPSLALKPTGAPSKLDADETTSPSFPPDTMMNDFLGSSPTPSSSRKRSEEPCSDDNPESSPPLVSSHLQVQRTILSPDCSQSIHRDEAPHGNENQLDETTAILLAKLSSAGDQPASAPSDHTDDNACLRASPSVVDTNILSDMEIYVDAPTELSRDASPEASGVDVVSEQSPNQATSYAASENDQVTAQIMGEIAKAASQQSSPALVDLHRAEETAKKRKATVVDEPRKRRKDGALVPSSGESVAECVLISESSSIGSPPVIDRDNGVEQSTSPRCTEAVTKRRGSTLSIDVSMDDPTFVSQESDLAIGAPASTRRRVRIKAEPGANRRSGRITRTSSRFSDVPVNSPISSEAPPASRESAEGDPMPWIHGPRGSRWAYVPATAPSGEQEFVRRPSDLSSTKDCEDAASQQEEIRPTSSSACTTAQPVEAASETSTADGILQGLQKMLDSIQKVALGPEEERQAVSLLFASVQQVHEAGRRHAMG